MNSLWMIPVLAGLGSEAKEKLLALSGPGTDIRLKDPACNLFVAAQKDGTR